MNTRILSQDPQHRSDLYALSTGGMAPGLVFEPVAKEVETAEGLAEVSVTAWPESLCRLVSSDLTLSCPAQL